MEDQRLNKRKMVWIQTGTPGDVTQSYKVVKDMELNKDMINHSFHSINSKAHSDFMHLSRLKKNKDKKCFEGYIIALSVSMP